MTDTDLTGHLVTVHSPHGTHWMGQVTRQHRTPDGELNGIARVIVLHEGNTWHVQGTVLDLGVRTLQPALPELTFLTCATVSCDAQAGYLLTWAYRSDPGALTTEVVCGRCGDSYLRRVALRVVLQQLCGHHTGYGLPWSLYCTKPGTPDHGGGCADHPRSTGTTPPSRRAQ